MPRRVAFLRAVNVGGIGRLPMADLRRLAARLGFRDVETLGASGNLLYTSRASPTADAAKLGAALDEEISRPVVVVRTPEELASLVAADPFAATPPAVPTKWRFVAFLAKPNRKPLPPVPDDVPVELAARRMREVAYAIARPDLKAIAWPQRIERALGAPVTVRNWNVVCEIDALLRRS
ncbi:MAG: DUF1697 domain-containing protein [Methanobacteriota archaeon]